MLRVAVCRILIAACLVASSDAERSCITFGSDKADFSDGWLHCPGNTFVDSIQFEDAALRGSIEMQCCEDPNHPSAALKNCETFLVDDPSKKHRYNSAIHSRVVKYGRDDPLLVWPEGDPSVEWCCSLSPENLFDDQAKSAWWSIDGTALLPLPSSGVCTRVPASTSCPHDAVAELHGLQSCSCYACGQSVATNYGSGSCAPESPTCSATASTSGCYTECATECDCATLTCKVPRSPERLAFALRRNRR